MKYIIFYKYKYFLIFDFFGAIFRHNGIKMAKFLTFYYIISIVFNQQPLVLYYEKRNGGQVQFYPIPDDIFQEREKKKKKSWLILGQEKS